MKSFPSRTAQDILKSIKTCPDAYAIFETEAARDTAVEAANQSGGIEFAGNTITLNASRVEPQTVNWRTCNSTADPEINTDSAPDAEGVTEGFQVGRSGGSGMRLLNSTLSGTNCQTGTVPTRISWSRPSVSVLAS